MNITIAGYGFVGIAHEAVLKDIFNVTIYDPFKGYTDIGNPDGVIVCVSTPSNDDGSCNCENVIDVIGKINETTPILIKSTISVEGWQTIKQRFPKHLLAFSPEFLRSDSAIEDFKHTRHIYMAGDEIGFWHAVFRVAFNDSTFTTEVAVAEELILAKYFRNSFLATKVTFFNQMYDLCNAMGINYGIVSHLVSVDNRIGRSHTGITEERGFGGHCFPKDTAAIVNTAKTVGVDLELINSSIKYNERIRKQK
jgi:UDPglucose 6-dehydrogenase